MRSDINEIVKHAYLWVTFERDPAVVDGLGPRIRLGTHDGPGRVVERLQIRHHFLTTLQHC